MSLTLKHVVTLVVALTVTVTLHQLTRTALRCYVALGWIFQPSQICRRTYPILSPSYPHVACIPGSAENLRTIT